ESRNPAGHLPGLGPATLGDPSFLSVHHVRFPYICGEMANGIASVEMVTAIAKAGMLGFFGAAGLPLPEIERAIATLKQNCGGLPVAEDFSVEADSGGHTDNRPLTVLLPAILLLRDELAAKHGWTRPIRIGAAGGIGAPASVSAAFAMGAAYVLTGSINQSAVESALSPAGKKLLTQASATDVMMAPAADMF